LICGGLNQPCCKNGSSTDFICNEDSGLVCDLGFCSTPSKY
jgi:hypothetical protein